MLTRVGGMRGSAHGHQVAPGFAPISAKHSMHNQSPAPGWCPCTPGAGDSYEGTGRVELTAAST